MRDLVKCDMIRVLNWGTSFFKRTTHLEKHRSSIDLAFNFLSLYVKQQRLEMHSWSLSKFGVEPQMLISVILVYNICCLLHAWIEADDLRTTLKESLVQTFGYWRDNRSWKRLKIPNLNERWIKLHVMEHYGPARWTSCNSDSKAMQRGQTKEEIFAVFQVWITSLTAFFL